MGTHVLVPVYKANLSLGCPRELDKPMPTEVEIMGKELNADA